MAEIGELVAKFRADTSDFSKKIDEAGSKVNDFSSSLEKIGKVAAASFAVASASIVATWEFVDKTTEKLDELAKVAEKLGVSFESLQALKYAAEISNVSIDTLQTSMTKLTRVVDSAANGNEQAAAALARLNLSGKELIALSLDKQYLAVTDALSKVKNATEANAIAIQLFGKAGLDNMTFVREGGAKLIDEFDQLGLTISSVQAESADAFQDAKTRMTGLFSNFSQQVGADLAPAFTTMLDFFRESITKSTDLRESAKMMAVGLAEGMSGLLGAASSVLQVLDAIIDRLHQLNILGGLEMLYKGSVGTVSAAFEGKTPSASFAEGFDKRITGNGSPAELSNLGGDTLAQMKIALDQTILKMRQGDSDVIGKPTVTSVGNFNSLQEVRKNNINDIDKYVREQANTKNTVEIVVRESKNFVLELVKSQGFKAGVAAGVEAFTSEQAGLSGAGN